AIAKSSQNRRKQNCNCQVFNLNNNLESISNEKHNFSVSMVIGNHTIQEITS
uniref:Uncharacterized protein n=1 Tax=Loxodonta africana TaxID=9785 RepID=G3UH40_LOXAF